PPPPVVLAFTPGSAHASDAELARIAPIVERLREDETLQITVRHDLGGGDVASEYGRANPTVDDCRDLAHAILGRVRELDAERSKLAADVRASLAAGIEANDLGRLRDLEVQLGIAQRALDALGELRRPGAEHGQSRRARDASNALARERLAGVEQVLRS